MSPSQGHTAQPSSYDINEALSASVKAIQDNLPNVRIAGHSVYDERPQQPSSRDAFYILLPMLIVLSTFLFLLLLFLVCVILLRKRRGIMLRDTDGPVDMSREDLIEGEGGFEGVESRWLETVSESERRAYQRSKGTCAISRVFVYTDAHANQIQNTSFSIHRTPCLRISHFLNSSPYRRKAYPRGRSSPISRLCLHCSYMLVLS